MLELVPEPPVVCLHLFHFVVISFYQCVPGGNLVFEKGNDGDGFFEELVFEKLCFEARLSLAEVLDEAEEVEDVGGAGLNLSGGA